MDGLIWIWASSGRNFPAIGGALGAAVKFFTPDAVKRSASILETVRPLMAAFSLWPQLRPGYFNRVANDG